MAGRAVRVGCLVAAILAAISGAAVLLPVEPATLRSAPVLAFEGPGSIALALEDGSRVTLVIPRGVGHFPDPEEAKGFAGVRQLSGEELALALQAQLRRAGALARDAAQRDALIDADVEPVEGPDGDLRLLFRSGRSVGTGGWTFVCPGLPDGPGAAPPLREPSSERPRALCPSKYASPLVAAVGAHPKLPGAHATQAKGRAPAAIRALAARVGDHLARSGMAAEPARGVRGLGWALLGVALALGVAARVLRRA